MARRRETRHSKHRATTFTPFPEIEGHIAAPEVTAPKVAPIETPEQSPPTNAEEEAVASNPPPMVEEPTNEVTSRYMGSHAVINLEKEEPAADINNKPPPA